MSKLTVKEIVITIAFGLVGWALCDAVIGIGRSVTSMENTLNVHLVLAPLIFILLSAIYFAWFRYMTPLQTAVTFILTVVFMDFFVVAPLLNGSYEMFGSIIGTWLPFALIFAATCGTGLVATRQKPGGAAPIARRPAAK